MHRIIYRHVRKALPGETEEFREVLVNGTSIIEREKVVDHTKTTAERTRYKTLERNVDPSFAGYDLVQLIVDNVGVNFVDAHQAVYDLGGGEGAKIEVNLQELRQVFVDHPRHHWSPAMTSAVAKLAGRVNWDTPAKSLEEA